MVRARGRIHHGYDPGDYHGGPAAIFEASRLNLVSMSRTNITLYTRTGCHLCEEAKQVLEEARTRWAFDLQEIDIDSDPALKALYNEEVPVIAINGVKAFKYRVTVEELTRKLAART